jgi:hypothetical protein
MADTAELDFPVTNRSRLRRRHERGRFDRETAGLTLYRTGRCLDKTLLDADHMTYPA